MRFQVASVFLLLVVTLAVAEYADFGYHHHDSGHHNHKDLDYYAYPKYSYKYGVQDKKTGDFKTAHEVRDGDVTHGSYSFLQPDGVLRTVKYTVTPKEGFKAVVINSGHGIHHMEHHIS